MSRAFSLFSSSIFKKMVMGITGLIWCGFMFSHMIGNYLLVVGKDAFNLYAHTLTSNPLIYGAEAFLLVVFLVHLFLAIRLTVENRSSRPVAYYMKTKTGKGINFASDTMPYTGIIILAFLISHLIGLKYGAFYTTSLDGQEVRDLYRLTLEYFSNPACVGWYVFSMIALGIHVSHGFASAFQSIGFNHPSYTPKIRLLAKIFAVVHAIGFSILPIWAYAQGGL